VTLSRSLHLLVLTLLLIVTTLAAPALAANGEFTPGDECAPSHSRAVGDPAVEHEQSDPAGPPHSFNNPGNSQGSKGYLSPATAHCHNA
jgi:hypothetical protein